MSVTMDAEPDESSARPRAGRAGRSWREWIIRLALLLVGLTVAHLGVTLFILPALGSDPFTIFVQGLARVFSVSVGTAHVGTTICLMLIMLLTTRGYVLPGTVVCSFFGGPIIDAFSWLLREVVTPDSVMVVRIVSMLLGCVILAAGMALVIRSDAGTGANDLVAVILTDKIGRFQFRWVRVACDITFALTGFLLGGVLGIGSLAAAFLVGPVAQFCFPLMDRVVGRAVRSDTG